jgi:hypothetical protein
LKMFCHYSRQAPFLGNATSPRSFTHKPGGIFFGAFEGNSL